MCYLQRILDQKRQEVVELKRGRPKELYVRLSGTLPSCRDFSGVLRRPEGGGLRLIAEIKKASPSRGVIFRQFDPEALAGLYLGCGASAFSVLTDREFFQGSNDYLKTVRRRFSLPLLRKDFIIDEHQIYESRLIGADAVLLIVAILSRTQLVEYLQLASAIGLASLVEVHDFDELACAVEAGAAVIGVNNRNLKDFTVCLDTSVELRPHLPDGVLSVSESGLKSEEDVERVASAGFDAVLIGEGLCVNPALQRLAWKGS